MDAVTLSVRIKLPEESELSPQDVDWAVATLQRDLRWGFVRRRLLATDLDARTALAFADIAVEIQSHRARAAS